MFVEPEGIYPAAMEVDFKQLTRSHLSYKQRLEAEVRAGLKVDLRQLRDEGATDLGRWIAGIDSLLGTTPEFLSLRDSNHEFHLVVAAVVDRLQKASPSNTPLPLKGIGIYESASMSLCMALRSLEHALADQRR